MNFDDFLKKSNLPENFKTKEIWLEWLGYFDYYYERERYGEGDSVRYADSMISKQIGDTEQKL